MESATLSVVAIAPTTRLGAVRLTVGDPGGEREFYEGVVGLRPVQGSRDGDLVTLGANGTPIVELEVYPSAPPRPRGTTGLFHLAILFADRPELASVLRRIAASRWPMGGASDHLVSEALYTDDAEGNGIELYRDRPRDEWTRSGDEVDMATLPLDVQALAADAPPAGEEARAAAPETRLGHVHLNVSDLDAAEAFYAGVLGFEVMTRSYPGALFVSAGGYHHHIGLNTWVGPGAPPPVAGSRGLRWFEVVLPDGGELERVEASVREAGAPAESRDDGLLTADPSGNGVLLRSAA
jgi:catechol 2,3-dioxygenase